eukprot:357816-Chlamydomonas_euryale.AAC.3
MGCPAAAKCERVARPRPNLVRGWVAQAQPNITRGWVAQAQPGPAVRVLIRHRPRRRIRRREDRAQG